MARPSLRRTEPLLLEDEAMRKLLSADLPPAMYMDEQAAYASNEIAINWNAPLVFLLAAGLPGK